MADSYWERRFWNPEIQTMPRKELKELQEKKLLRQLRYAYENAPFYHELYDKEKVDVYKLKTIEDFRKYVPSVEKEDVRKYRERTGDIFGGICCLPLKMSNFSPLTSNPNAGRLFRSTGTTGLPTMVMYTENDISNSGEMAARLWWAAGIRPGDRILDYISMPWHTIYSPIADGFKKIGLFYYREDFIMFWELGLELAKGFDVQQIWTGPMPMRPIAQKLEREGKNLKRDYFPHLKNVLQCNELSVSLMAYYNKVFGVPIVNGGAVSEAMYAGGSCIDEGDVGTFLHMHEDMIFIEVFDPRKEVPVEGLEFGQGVFTNMYFQSMAYVRFRSEDWDRVRWDPCPYCGATHMQMRFMGRISESADVKGRIVTAAEIEDIVYTRPESLFLPIQIIREEPQPQDKLRLRICYHEDRVKEPERYRLEVEELAKRELKVDTSVELITPQEVKSVGGFKFERVKKVKRGE